MSENKVIDKQFKLDAVQYRKDHPELTFQQVADNLGVSNSSIHRWCKQFDDARLKMKIVIYSEDQAIFQVMKPKN
ncbi:transposase [Catenibacterium sp.]|uniref:transposase n=1 Tax=Catenibacterium sp. TaxID=2049022 RepID=UPI00399503D3